jgi:hypothetical protein
MHSATASAVSVLGFTHNARSRRWLSGGGAFACATAIVIVAVLALAMAVPSEANAAGAARYVAKTGSDSTGSGTLASPWATIQKAANTMAAGDTVHIGAGTYNERVTVSSAKSGTAPAHTVFVADGAVVVSKGFVLESSYTDLSGFEITPGVETGGDRVGQIDIGGDHNTVANAYIHDLGYRSGISLRVGASYNTITDFRIREVPAYAITLSDTYNAGSDHTTVRNGTISQHRGWCAIEVTGDNHLIEGVTISGPSGTGPSGDDLDGDGIRVNYSRDSVIRKCTIHDLWEYYSDPQHTDCIQTWVGTYNLTIDSCVLGTWQPGPANRPDGSGGYLPQEIGPSQLIMCGTVPSSAHVDFTAKNCLFLGQCGTNASIVTARNSNSTIGINLYNNTFWSSYPSLNSVSSAVLRNNIFRSFYLYPANMGGIDSDYNAYCWVGGSGSNNVPTSEGAHSLGKTYAARVTPNFVNPDITASGGWGWGGASDFSLAAGSPLANAGVAGAGVPTVDILDALRDVTPDMGAYESAGTVLPPVDDVTPPASVVGLTAARNAAGVSVAWTNPIADFASTRVLRSTSGFAAAATDTVAQAVVFEGATSGFTDSTAPTSAVFYSAYARDAAGNWSTRATAQVAAASTDVVTVTPTLVLSASASRVAVGKPVTLQARLRAQGASLRGRADVTVWSRTTGAWSYNGTATYDAASDTYRVTRTQRKQTSYQFRFSGDSSAAPRLASCQSNVVTVSVTSSVSRASLSRAAVAKGGKVALSAVAMAAPSASAKVKAYQLVGGRWRYRSSYTLKAVASGSDATRYRGTVKAKRRGVWRFVTIVADDNGLAKGPASRRLRVR